MLQHPDGMRKLAVTKAQMATGRRDTVALHQAIDDL